MSSDLLSRLKLGSMPDDGRLVVMAQNPAQQHHWSHPVGAFTAGEVRAATAQSSPGEEALREVKIQELIHAANSAVGWMRLCTESKTMGGRFVRLREAAAALSLQALPVGEEGFSSVGKLSSATKTPSREADGDREPAGVRE